MTPAMMLIMIPALMWPAVTRAPQSALSVGASLFPPATPFLMLLRLALEERPPVVAGRPRRRAHAGRDDRHRLGRRQDRADGAADAGQGSIARGNVEVGESVEQRRKTKDERNDEDESDEVTKLRAFARASAILTWRFVVLRPTDSARFS